ncbi:MAG: hypothetical protein HKN47_06275, partial [Pirellulaceae bacterium]|nr:hypothetical protein [Pirellulaceae bacterium]
MQIKCPKCGKLLNIPETAAGKIVKCPCGTQLRAPGGGAKATATKPPAGQKPAAKPAAQRPAAPKTAGPKPAAQKPAAQKPAGQKPAGTAQRPATPAAGGGLDAGLFDELTESDLGTVAPVLSPGRQTRRSNAAAQSGPTGSITVGLIFI